MATTYEIAAEIRHDLGKGASRRLRRTDAVPGIVYGGEKSPENLAISHHKLIKALEDEGFYSQLIDLNIDGNKQKVVLKALQRHPYKPKIVHVDFLRVSSKAAIHMRIPLHFIGEDQAPGVKNGGIVSHHVTEIEIKCLPQDLPPHIEVDISGLELDQGLHLFDLKLPEKVSLTVDTSDNNYNASVVSIHAPKAEVEEEAPAEQADQDQEDADASQTDKPADDA